MKDDANLNGVPKGKLLLEVWKFSFSTCIFTKLQINSLSIFLFARGLDYYTEVIFEAVLTDTDKIGPIFGRERYEL